MNFHTAVYIENTMFMSFDMKLNLARQKTRRNGEAQPRLDPIIVAAILEDSSATIPSRHRVGDAPFVICSLNNGCIFEKKTAKESLLIWLANSVIIIAVQMQFNDTKEAPQKKSARLSYRFLLTCTKFPS